MAPEPPSHPTTGPTWSRGQTLEALKDVAAARPAALLALMQASDGDPEAVIQAVEGDAAVCARVVSACHTVAGGGATGVTTVRRAVLHLGPKRVKTLGLAFGVRLMAEALPLPRPLLEGLWRASLWKAEAAALVAETLEMSKSGKPPAAEQADEDRPEERAYVLGLLQDLGLPALLSLDAADWAERVGTPDAAAEPAHARFRELDLNAWCAFERQRFGLSHAEAGAALLRKWGLPVAICRAVAMHHEPALLDPCGGRGANVKPDGADAASADGVPSVHLSLRLPMAAAAILPHLPDHALSESAQRAWGRLHASRLSGRFATPQDALDAVARRTLGRLGGDIDADPVTPASLMVPLLDAVSHATVDLVEHSMRPQGTTDATALERLQYQAFTDDLTRLLSRRGFTRLARERMQNLRDGKAPPVPRRRLHRGAPNAATEVRPQFASSAGTPSPPRIAAARPQPGAACVLLFDLNRFKPINDTYGHAAGDLALRSVADALRRAMRGSDLLGRIGGDEFVALMDHIPESAARQQAQRIHAAASGTPVALANGETLHVRFSLGAAWTPKVTEAVTLEDLLDAADRAMYRAKADGGGVGFQVVGGSGDAAEAEAA